MRFGMSQQSTGYTVLLINIFGMDNIFTKGGILLIGERT